MNKHPKPNKTKSFFFLSLLPQQSIHVSYFTRYNSLALDSRLWSSIVNSSRWFIALTRSCLESIRRRSAVRSFGECWKQIFTKQIAKSFQISFLAGSQHVPKHKFYSFSPLSFPSFRACNYMQISFWNRETLKFTEFEEWKGHFVISMRSLGFRHPSSVHRC